MFKKDDSTAVSLLGEAFGFVTLCKKNVLKADDVLCGEDAYCNDLMDIVGELYHVQCLIKKFLDSDWFDLTIQMEDLD